MRILIIEDDPRTAEYVRKGLREAGHIVAHATNARDAEILACTEPFARGDRCEGVPGSGLGLSLVAAVARLHEASISLEDNAPGLRVTLSLPAGGLNRTLSSPSSPSP